MSRSKTLLYCLAFAFFALTGCGNDDLRYRYGFDLNKLEFNLYTADMGVYPDTSVLDDPNNPFRWEPMGTQTKWTIESYGRVVPRVYAWATALATEPIGENQLYAAQALEDLYRQELTLEAYLPFVRPRFEPINLCSTTFPIRQLLGRWGYFLPTEYYRLRCTCCPRRDTDRWMGGDIR